MKQEQPKRFRLNLNYLLILVLLLFLSSFFYFIYRKYRSQAEIYASVILVKSPQDNSYIMTTSLMAGVPRWIAESIEVGDKDMSLLGSINTTVIGKEIYENQSFGNNVYLFLKVNALKDRSGIYLFKSKPLLVGTIIDLKLTKTQTYGLVTYIGAKPPSYKKEKLTVKLKGSQVDSAITESFKIGSAITNDKGETEVKIIDKKILPALPVSMNYESQSGRFILTGESGKNDLEITVEILAKNINNAYYYAETQKLKAGEYLLLPFKEAIINFSIVSVVSAEK